MTIFFLNSHAMQVLVTDDFGVITDYFVQDVLDTYETVLEGS